MRRIHRLIGSIFLASLLVSCTVSEEIPPPPESPNPVPQEPVSAPTLDELARGSEVTASALLLTELPQSAVDGDLQTQWGSGKDAPQWIQLELSDHATIHQIRLKTAQYPEGKTVHQILAGASPSTLKLVHEFSGFTADNQTLEVALPEPVSGVKFIEVLTTQSPSWVSWKEIEVWGNYDAHPPTAMPEVLTADIIYINGQILTMEKDQPSAAAVAIRGDKILAVGSEAEVFSFQDDLTRVVDLNGMTVTPGFIDSHSHRIGDRWHYDGTSAEDMMVKALSQGWTSLHELFVFDQRLDELRQLAGANAMPMRVSMYLTMNFDNEYTTWWQEYRPLQSYGPYLQIAGLKITLDREWGEILFFEQAQLDQMTQAASQGAWQVATHSFSPAANELILNAYENALNSGSNEGPRYRIEHLGVMTDEQVRRMAELGIIGSVQFINASAWVDDPSFKRYIPESEVQHSARWRDLINAGVFLIGNTDDPWCCTDWRAGFTREPFEGNVPNAIYQGVTRRTFFEKEPEMWQVQQAVTVQEALEMMTINGAYAAHQEDVLGSLKPGKYADLVILSENPLAMAVEDIPTIQVVMTMVGGDVKYCAGDGGAVCTP